MMKCEQLCPPEPGYIGAIGRDMVVDFVDSIRSGRRPGADQDDALRVLKILDAVYENAAAPAGIG